ncbi:hypothetical protein K402DRAFT_420641 [Aulographum hederae CBS 113979]|uniref:Uncharacterized protein n=1 Tax=Aulographum hederae CBS 113979 TaxID=1176131 RepID=A0A6G1H1R0_9PEZI|nr:hypothetical protein K402DRAFT_420641 [Aulographum hederae CBS 113979]
MPPQQERLHPWVKFVLALTVGFLLGVLLGMLSTTMVVWLFPGEVIEQAIRDRRDVLVRKAKLVGLCGDNNFYPLHDPKTNILSLCACWPQSLYRSAERHVTCSNVQLLGGGEPGT